MNVTSSTSSLTELLSHSDWLRVLARKLVADEATADDLVQETWLAVMKNPPALDGSPRPWLAGVIRNMAKLRYRSESRRSRRQDEVAAEKTDLPSAAELVQQVETERHLASVVLTLDEPFRTTMLLRYFQDRSLADIAKSQNVPAATVRWRHARGLELLREGLRQEYGDNQSWCKALFVLARVASPSNEKSSIGGTALLGASSLLAALKFGMIVVAIGTAIWLSTFSNGGSRSSSPAKSVFAAELTGGPSRPDGRRVPGSSFVAAPVGERISGLDSLSTEDKGEPALATTPILRVQLLDESAGGSLEGRRIVLVDSKRRCHLGLVNSEGWAEFKDAVGALHLYVNRPNGFPYGQRVSGEAAELQIRLEAGSELSGRVQVGSQQAPAGIRLTLLSDEPLFNGKSWNKRVNSDIASLLGVEQRAQVITDADGRFRFAGLDADWSGVLYVPEQYRLGTSHVSAPSRFGGGSVRYAQPSKDTLVSLEQQSRLTGRVVEADGSQLKGGASLRLRGLDSMGEEFLIKAQSNALGEFLITLRDPAVSQLSIGYLADGGRGFVRTEFEFIAMAGPQDLGDLRLREHISCVVRVLDVAGAPLADAYVAGGPNGPPSAWTDDQGITRVYPDVEHDGLFEVRAKGYQTQLIRWESKDLGDLTVHMGVESSLDVQLLLPEPHRYEGLFLRVECAGGSVATVRREGEYGADGVLELPLHNRTGRMIRDLVPNQALTLSVVAPGGEVLSTQALDGLAPGESRPVEVDVQTSSRNVRLAIRDDASRRLNGATLTFRLNGEVIAQAHSDAIGCHRQDYLPASGVSLEVSMRGYCSRIFEGAAIPGQVIREDLMLSRARDVRLSLSSQTGRPLEFIKVEVISRVNAQRWSGLLRADGSVNFVDVPVHELDLIITLDGQERQLILPEQVTKTAFRL